MTKQIVYISIGLPGSGKSTYFKNLENIKVFSADEIRGKLFGDEGLQYTDDFLKQLGYKPEEMSEKFKRKVAGEIVWKKVHENVEKALSEGFNVAIDGTNISVKNRTSMIDRYKDKADIIGIYFATPLDKCIERDSRRNRSVGKELISRMSKWMQKPEIDEGFNKLITVDYLGRKVKEIEKNKEKEIEPPISDMF